MKNVLYYLVAGTLIFTSCNEEQKQETEETATTAVTMSPVEGSPEFDGATLGIASVDAEAEGDEVKVTFNFSVQNYELKSQTGDADNKMCSNSDKGQHIHFILDNEPYAALYEPTHSVTLAKNSEHYLMAFLSRSYHESVKAEGAAMVFHFKVDENGKVQQLEEPTTPMVFYSRPKGDYVGEKNTENLLFDYYVWNTTLGNEGHQVKAHIKASDVDTTIVLTDWRANFLHNMPMGKPEITLTLADKDGNKVDGPMTEVTRQFTLSADEPLAQ